MRMILAVAAAASLLGGCSEYGGIGMDPQYQSYASYDYDRPDPAYNGYYADRYYVDAPRYRERRLAANDRVYRGQDGRYYCRRPDGTTGLIVGAAAGGILGNLIASGGSQTIGTLLGAAGGALAGRAIERNQFRCR